MTRDELQPIWSPIVDDIEGVLNNAGIYYRIFARGKSESSIKRKLNDKREDYLANKKKMQDIIGIRIIFYFPDDVPIVMQYLKTNLDTFDNESNSEEDIAKAKTNAKFLSDLTDKVFMPSRLNLVFRLREELAEDLSIYLSDKKDKYDITLIDSSYEIQLRTVLSEGWHEVEHDLRYKTKNEKWWEYCSEESRILNGIMATLETSEWTLQQAFSSIAYKNYHNNNWDAMIRTHFRIRLKEVPLSEKVSNVLSSNDGYCAKEVFRFTRKELLEALLSLRFPIELTPDNIVFLINELKMKNQDLYQLTPQLLKDKYSKIKL